MALLVGNIAAVFSFFLAGNADATGINNYLDGTWSGTETCFQHCDFNGPGGSYSPGKVQGTVEARLTLKNGSGVYIVGNEDPGNLAVATEFVNGDFAAGHIVTDGERHGTFQVLANETHLYGTWMTYASKRSFRWEMSHAAPAPPPPPPPPPPQACSTFTSREKCDSYFNPTEPKCTWDANAHCISRVSKMFDVFESNTVASWGTKYACFRVPSTVQALNGDIVIFVESRIASCNDQAPKDITMKVWKHGQAGFGPLQLVVGPKQHAPSAANCTDGSDDCRDFSSRNPYATVRGMVKDANTASDSSIGRSGSMGSNGDIILGWVNSTKSSTCINFQNVLTVNAATGEWEVGEAMRVDMGKIEGVLAGPGQGIVLGRHSQSSPKPNRIVGCGATGYVGGMPQSTVVWTSDDGGESYQIAVGTGLPAMAGMAECQVVELKNGTIVVNSRNEIRGTTHPKTRAAAISNDGGATFQPFYYVDELEEPTCSAGMINVGGTVYFSNPASKTHRDQMTVKKSSNGGETWEIDTPIFGGPSAYSNLVPIGVPVSNSYGVVFENGEQVAYERISFAEVKILN